MVRGYFCNYYKKILTLICLAVAVLLIFNYYREKELLPQPEFPLSEVALSEVLDESGLPWTIEETYEATDGTIKAITYSLHIPGIKEDYHSVHINSFYSEELGRRLQVYFNEPQNKQWWNEEDDAGWEDWRELLILLARLYGGFQDAEEIYRTCSAEELPRDAYVLWQGTLTGGYFRMETFHPMRPERFSKGNMLRFDLYESEGAYLKFREMVEESKNTLIH